MTTDDQTPPPAPTPPRAAGSPVPTSARTPTAPATRNWLLRWRRTTQPTPPDYNDGLDTRTERMSLLYRSPFYIGFFLAAGAMTAYVLLTSIAGLAGHLVVSPELPPGLLLWVPAAVIGGVVGALVGRDRLDPRILRRILAALLAAAGLRLIMP